MFHPSGDITIFSKFVGLMSYFYVFVCLFIG